MIENKSKKNFLTFLNFTHRPKFQEDNILSALPPTVLGQRNERGINFPPNEAKRFMKIHDLPFFIALESQEVLENKGIRY
jgi:hypothetical protein